MERTFDRVPSFDPRSRAFPIRTLLTSTTPRSYTWGCNVVLDQGPDGACVGFAWSHERAARPVAVPTTYDDAFSLYKQAQLLDEWADTPPYEGTSVLAGAKVAMGRAWLREFRWCFGLNDVLAAVSRHGPVVLGVNWYTGMLDTDDRGFIHVEGDVVGGHAILARGVSVSQRTVLLHQSWSPSWGGTRWGPGTCLISWDDLERLLYEQGEACAPVLR
jgi:hypothetical protein